MVWWYKINAEAQPFRRPSWVAGQGGILRTRGAQLGIPSPNPKAWSRQMSRKQNAGEQKRRPLIRERGDAEGLYTSAARELASITGAGRGI